MTYARADVAIAVGLFPLPVASGMLGLGAAFAAVLIVAVAAGSVLTARLTSPFVSGPVLERAFEIVMMTTATACALVSARGGGDGSAEPAGHAWPRCW